MYMNEDKNGREGFEKLTFEAEYYYWTKNLSVWNGF